MDIEVKRSDTNKLVAYACPDCGQLFAILGDDAGAPGRARKLASGCCPPKVCPRCNANPVVRGQLVCPACASAAGQAAEQERFAAASKVREADWKEAVYWPGARFDGDHGGRYWSSIAALRKDVGERNAIRASQGGALVGLPAFVWATRPIPFRIAAVSVIAAALADHSDDAVIPDPEAEKLQKLLDDWAAGQKVSSYEEDLSQAVVLG